MVSAKSAWKEKKYKKKKKKIKNKTTKENKKKVEKDIHSKRTSSMRGPEA